MAQRHRTDGSRRCPGCGGTPINVQGLVDCPDCNWRSDQDQR